jgi:hypothetical protein
MIPKIPPLIPIGTVDPTQNYDQVKIDDQQLLNLMKKMPLNNTMLMKTKHKEKERNNECKQILCKQEDQYLRHFSPIETKFGYKNKIRNRDMIPSTITSQSCNSLAENAMDIGKTSLKCTRLKMEKMGLTARYNILVTLHKLLYLLKVT